MNGAIQQVLIISIVMFEFKISNQILMINNNGTREQEIEIRQKHWPTLIETKERVKKTKGREDR